MNSILPPEWNWVHQLAYMVIRIKEIGRKHQTVFSISQHWWALFQVETTYGFSFATFSPAVENMIDFLACVGSQHEYLVLKLDKVPHINSATGKMALMAK